MPCLAFPRCLFYEGSKMWTNTTSRDYDKLHQGGRDLYMRLSMTSALYSPDVSTVRGGQ